MMKVIKTFVVAFLLAPALLPADTVYNIAVSTAPYSGQAGYLDFQVGRGPDSQTATVTVENFAGTGSLMSGSLQTAGNVSGALPGAVTLGNTTQFNDYFQGYTFSGTISFTLVFSGPAINAPNGTSSYGTPFVFGLYNASQQPLGPNDGSGNSLLIQVNTNGTTTPTIYNPGVKVNAGPTVPEPGTLGLLAVASVAAFGLIRRRQQQ